MTKLITIAQLMEVAKEKGLIYEGGNEHGHGWLNGDGEVYTSDRRAFDVLLDKASVERKLAESSDRKG